MRERERERERERWGGLQILLSHGLLALFWPCYEIGMALFVRVAHFLILAGLD